MVVVKLSKIGFGQAEKLCTLSVDIHNCLYSTIQLPGASLATAEVSLTLWETFETEGQIDKQRDGETAVFVEF